MMKNKLLTKHCVLLLLALLAVWSTQAWADVTVNVKCDVAPTSMLGTIARTN